MLLASQVAGALAAGLIVVILARSCGLSARRAIATVAVISISVAALLSVPNLRTAVAAFVHQREENSALTAAQKSLQAGTLAEVDVDFLGWARERLPPEESFQLIVGHPARTALVPQWALFQLMPNLAVAAAEPGDWVVFYDVAPARYSTPGYYDLEVYAPGFAIARYRVAG
jgi:hypothetical protein